MAHYDELERLDARSLLRWAMETFADGLVISTSFQREGMVILDMAARINPNVRVITLDTGRLPEETHQMIEMVRERYGVRVELVFPDPKEVEELVTRHGPNLFYRSVQNRALCCEIRKVRPLERKLAGFRAWVAGLRRTQSVARAGLRKAEERGGLLKLSPLADWTPAQVAAYIAANGVPEHPLYSRGYTSIGCAPCTRAVGACEDERAGRWWWEQDTHKECGIHFSPDGGVQRGLDIRVDEIQRGVNA